MSRYFLFPFRSAGLLLVATFSLGLVICAKAGFLGIPAGVLFISWFFKYCFVMLDAVIAGAEEPPVLDADMVNPVSEQRPVMQAALIALGVMLVIWVWRNEGRRLAYLCAAILVLALPASIAVMGISGNAFAAAWPPRLAHFIRSTRRYYLVPVLMMLAGALLVAWMTAVEAPMWMWIACTQLLLLLTFSLVGGVVHEHRFELGIDTLTRQEREAARTEREHASARAQMLDRAYAKFNVRRALEGWAEIQKWIEVYTADELLTEYREVLKATSAWPDPGPADRLASDLIAALLARGRTGEALGIVEERLASNPKFRPAEEAHTIRLAELAGFAGKRALQRQLDPRTDQRS